MDYAAFVTGNKTLLVAPAGYGKTHTIVECLKHAQGVQLILTHTHAGVAAIKEKFKKENIASSCYRIETISSFAQKYVHAFYTGGDIPAQEDSKNYHTFIIKSAIEIFKSTSVRRVLTNTYQGMFVDEYQDCSKEQHSMIMQISDILPTHILGDPLQGIFSNINGSKINFDADLAEFTKFPELETPYRWYQEENNSALGEKIKGFREKLQRNLDIELDSDSSSGFYYIKVEPEDIRDSESKYRKCINKLIQNPDRDIAFNSLLIVVPEYEELKENGVKIPKGGISDRAQIRKQFDYAGSIHLLEAIDDRSFYSFAKAVDQLLGNINRAHKKIDRIYNLLEKIFNKTELKEWFKYKENRLIEKRTTIEKEKCEKLNYTIQAFIQLPSPEKLHQVIETAKNELKLKYKRDELVYGTMSALKAASLDGTTVYDAMKKNRNVIRRMGRKVQGKCIGTTLLTKGLEFDTVAILDAHKFNCPKHLYVALSRGCKKLIVFSNTPTLSPYPNA